MIIKTSGEKSYLQLFRKWLAGLFQLFSGKTTISRSPVGFEESDLPQLKMISLLRASCIDLAAEVRTKSEREQARFPENTRLRVNEILEALPTSTALRAQVRMSPELLQQNLRSLLARADAAAHTTALSEWQKNLQEQRELLLRLQRYISLAISKLPIEVELKQKSKLSKSELTRAQQLNMEIVACELLLGREEVESLPSNVQIEPTNRCNARCKSCSHRSPVGWSYYDMDISSLDKLDHVLSIAQFVEIFGLGEPTISPSFSHISELCSTGVSETHIITNGTMLTENPDVGKLNKVGISLDGATKETFEILRVGIDFNKLIASLREFRVKNPGIFIYFTCTINRANLHEIPMMAQLCRDLDLQAICFHRMSTGVPELVNQVLTNEDIAEYRKRIEEAKGALTGSEVKLFDYLIAEQLPSAREPLNPEQSLVAIKSFAVKKEQFSGDLSKVIQELKAQTVPYPLTNSVLELLDAVGDQARNVEQPEVAPVEESAPLDHSLAELERRAIALKNEVLERAPAGLKIPYCLAAWYRLYVKADGHLVPCCTWSYGYSNINAVRNFNDSWNGSFQRMLRRGFHGRGELTDACKNCISIDRYQGMTELLMFLRSLGISYDQIQKQEGFNPPAGKLQL